MNNQPDEMTFSTPRTWTEHTVKLLLDGASEQTIQRHGELAMRHTRILSGDECPQCASRNTMENCFHTEAQCADCGCYWDFAEWEEVRIDGGRLVRSTE
jgi:Zn ribbon nucleic-acid-binding protein